MRRNHEDREKILAHIKANPGPHTGKSISQATGVSYALTLVYMDTLAKETNWVKKIRDHSLKVFYQVSGVNKLLQDEEVEEVEEDEEEVEMEGAD